MKRAAIPALLASLALLTGFTFRISDDPGTLDWGNGEVAPLVVQQLMEGLTTSDAEAHAIPALAARWSVSDGGRRYTFELRRGASWSDGHPVCAQDFVDAWLRVLSPAFASPYAHLLFDLARAREYHSGQLKDPTLVGVRARGCGRLEVNLERPAAYFPLLASHWVLLPARLDLIVKFGAHWTDPAHLAVTGPYLLTSWDHDKELVLRRNPRYWGPAARESELRAEVVGDDSTALNLFRAGRLDWMRDIPYLDKPGLAASSAFSSTPSLIEYHLGFAMTAAGASGAELDRDGRCALSSALDKSQIPGLLKGSEVPADRLAPFAGSVRTPSPAPLFDAVRARALWARSAARGRPLELHYYAKDVHEPLVQWLQQQWKKNLGAEVRLVKTEGKTYWAKLGEAPPPIFLSGITAAYAHPYAFLSEFLSESRANWGRYSSRDYDALARRAAGEPAGLSAGVALSAQSLLLERDCAVIPLYFRETAALLAGGWTGVVSSPMGYVYFRQLRSEK